MELTLISALRLNDVNWPLTRLTWAKNLLSDLNPRLEMRKSDNTEATSFTHFKLRLCLPAWLQIRASCAVRLSGGYFNWTGSAPKPNKRTLWRETRVQNSKVRLGDSMVQWRNRDWCLSSWLHPWSCVILSELFNLVEPQGLHLWNTENDVYFKGWVGLFMR